MTLQVDDRSSRLGIPHFAVRDVRRPGLPLVEGRVVLHGRTVGMSTLTAIEDKPVSIPKESRGTRLGRPRKPVWAIVIGNQRSTEVGPMRRLGRDDPFSHGVDDRGDVDTGEVKRVG